MLDTCGDLVGNDSWTFHLWRLCLVHCVWDGVCKHLEIILDLTGNNFANLKVEVRISQFLAELMDCNCDSEILEEVLGVVDKIRSYMISKFLRFNFLSE